jgi:hypothetical protein
MTTICTAPDFNIPDADNGGLGFRFFTDQFERLGDGDGFFDAVQHQQAIIIDGAFIADNADGGPFGAGHGDAAEAHFFDFLDYCLNLFFSGVIFHYN